MNKKYWEINTGKQTLRMVGGVNERCPEQRILKQSECAVATKELKDMNLTYLSWGYFRGHECSRKLWTANAPRTVRVQDHRGHPWRACFFKWKWWSALVPGKPERFASEKMIWNDLFLRQTLSIAPWRRWSVAKFFKLLTCRKSRWFKWGVSCLLMSPRAPFNSLTNAIIFLGSFIRKTLPIITSLLRFEWQPHVTSPPCHLKKWIHSKEKTKSYPSSFPCRRLKTVASLSIHYIGFTSWVWLYDFANK